jgi:O-antigen/teichoic acid export membrane protein
MVFFDFYKKVGLLTAVNLFTQLRNYIFIPIIISLSSVSTYGTYVLISTIFSIVSGVYSLGVGYNYRRNVPSIEDQNAKQNYFYDQFFFGFFSIIVFSACLVLLNDFFLLKYEVENYSAYIIPLFLISYFLYEQFSNYFKYTLKIKYVAVSGFLYAVIPLIIVLIFFNTLGLDLNLNYLFGIIILTQALLSFYLFVKLHKDIGFIIVLAKRSAISLDMKKGLPLVMVFISDLILAASDRFVIGYYMSSEHVGLYNVAYMLGVVIMIIPKGIMGILPQFFSKLIDANKVESANKLLSYSMNIFFIIFVPFVVIMSLFSSDAIADIVQKSAIGQASLVSIIISISSPFFAFYIFSSGYLFALRKTSEIFYISLAIAIFNLISNIILLSYYPLLFIPAATTLISYIFGSLLCVGYAGINVKLINKKIFIKVIISSSIMLLVSWFISVDYWLVEAFILFSIYILLMLSFNIYQNLLDFWDHCYNDRN